MDESEMIYCKNNVCVHPPSRDESEHYPGYLSIKTTSTSTLILCWIPNSSIKRNPRSLENRTPTHSPCQSSRSSACPSPRKSPRHSLSSIHSISTNLPNFANEKCVEDDLANQSQEGSPAIEELDGGDRTVGATKSTFDSGFGSEDVSVNALETMTESVERQTVDTCNRPVFTFDIELIEDDIENDNRQTSKSDALTTEGAGNTEETEPDLDKILLKQGLNLNLDRSSSTLSQNIQSPNQSESVSVNSHDIDLEEVAQSCVFSKTSWGFEKTDLLGDSESVTTSPPFSSFSIDLCQMKSLRFLFNDRECTCGQLVIVTRERHYKILHFHHGGLDKLAQIFEDLDFLTKSKVCSLPYRLFSVTRPVLSDEECHPEESLFCTIDEIIWESYQNEQGQIEDEFQLKKAIFFGGINPNMRCEIWPFLLHCYPLMSTSAAREQIYDEHQIEYQMIDRKRESLSSLDKNSFFRNIQCTVEKDVVRTDRSHPFFAGDNNPNVEKMKNILLNYAIYNPSIGYTQGMSDILSPILIELQNEAETFWCFVGLMQRTIFISSPTDSDMDLHLNYIRELLRLLVPNFYKHLLTHPDYMELLFCHRWILLCFKREFTEAEALKMWEACWVQYETKYFHLFLCAAIVAIYCEDVIQQDMNSDEMLLYFSSLSMHMNGDLVLRKARGLLYQFLSLPRIPCTLKGFCDHPATREEDTIHCVGHQNQSDICSKSPLLE